MSEADTLFKRERRRQRITVAATILLGLVASALPSMERGLLGLQPGPSAFVATAEAAETPFVEQRIVPYPYQRARGQLFDTTRSLARLLPNANPVGAINLAPRIGPAGFPTQLVDGAAPLDPGLFPASELLPDAPTAAGPPITVNNFPGLATPVPEAATWLMLIGGLGAVAATMRRRALRPALRLAPTR